MFPVPTYFGQMGLGLPTETPEQQLARLSGNQSMGGGGTRKGLKFLLDDPNSNVSPTANAGTQLSRQRGQKLTPARLLYFQPQTLMEWQRIMEVIINFLA